jgi:hypothetical protein
MFHEYDVVRLKTDISSENLKAGARGTILLVYDEPALPRAYEIEFLDSEGKTVAILTLTEEVIELA